ncbi:MAG TPA: hypothetical protein DCQ98_06075 [Planctomycetaceae bacterium]|nr:hypothetical protein [Planctomycetaceae bacterium]HRF02840.1 hypothetical protein [Pirellulaceae bacterium]
MKLLSNAAATGSAVDWYGGPGSLFVRGTWDGATAKLQASPDGGTTWIDVPTDAANSSPLALTANGIANFQLGPCKLRGAISGAGGSTSLTADVV